MTGFAHQTGQADAPPTLPPFGLADGVAGLAGAIDAITTVQDEDLGPLRMQNVMFRLSQSPGSIRFTGRRLEVIHDVFTPSEQELTWAQAVLDAFAAAGGNAVKLPDGEFVDLTVADRARRLLEFAGRRPASAGASGWRDGGTPV